ncbi:unnamed protein product, partial [Anisakis simplex]
MLFSFCSFTKPIQIAFQQASQNPHRLPLRRVTTAKGNTIVSVSPTSKQFKYNIEVLDAMSELNNANKMPAMDE